MKDKRKDIFIVILLLNTFLPTVINAAGKNNRIEVILTYFLILSPILAITIIVNIIINKSKKNVKKQELQEKKVKEIDKVIENALPKERTTKEDEKGNQKASFKLDFKNNEKINHKMDVEVLSGENNKHKKHKVVLTTKRFGILNEDDSLHFETRINEIDSIRKKTNEDDTYIYTFKNKKTIIIKSKELREILKDK